MANAAKNLIEQQDAINWHWRNTMRPVRFFAMDARAAMAFLILLPNMARLSVWIFCLTVTFIFMILEKKGLVFEAALRRLRSWIIGIFRPAWNTIHFRKTIDFG